MTHKLKVKLPENVVTPMMTFAKESELTPQQIGRLTMLVCLAMQVGQTLTEEYVQANSQAVADFIDGMKNG